MTGKMFPAFPAHAQSAILRIWQEAHGMRERMGRWVTIDPGNDLLPDGTKPLSEPILIYHRRSFASIQYKFHKKGA